MKKGISPLIAVVLLIAASVTVAAILASWAKSYSLGQIGQFEKKTGEFECGAGVISFISDEYPKLVNDQIVAIIEVAGVPLGNFSFEVIYEDKGIENVAVLKDIRGVSIKPGRVDVIVSENLTDKGLNPSSIKKVRILSNCSEVKTEWRSLK